MSKVSRSTYQKVVEENKRLLKDIKLLIDKTYPMERIIVMAKWEKHFKKEEEFNMLMKQASKDWIENNPNDPAVIAFKQISDSVK